MTAPTATPFDFSDAREVLLETRAREERAASTLGHELAWNADWLAPRVAGSGFWTPFMVRSQGHLAVGHVRGFAAGGLVVDGRGIARESRFEVIAGEVRS